MEKCLKCGSKDVSGRVSSFWVRIDEDGDPVTRLTECVESDAEITCDRMCNTCGHCYDESGDASAMTDSLPEIAAMVAGITTSFSRLNLRFLEATSLYLERIIQLELEDQTTGKAK